MAALKEQAGACAQPQRGSSLRAGEAPRTLEEVPHSHDAVRGMQGWGDAASCSKPLHIGRGVSVLSAGALSACGGGGTGNSIQKDSGSTAEPSNAIEPSNDTDAARFLLLASLSASKGGIAQLRTLGYEEWLDRKIETPIGLTAAEFFSSHGYDQADEDAHFDRPHVADNMIWHQLMTGNDDVRKRIALALSNFFVVSVSNLSIRWPALAIGEYWDILNRHAFGSFRDLLEDLALNPAAGVFLDVIGSEKSNQTTGREPDENLAREIMQLYSIGLVRLNIDGTPTLTSGKEEPTFNAEDVRGLAKCFTGYNFDYSGLADIPHPANPSWQVQHPDSVRRRITADPSKWRVSGKESLHSPAEKSFLGVKIPAGSDAEATLKIALDTLFSHGNVGPFFSKQMIQYLITSNPSASYVERVSRVFNDNGKGVRGDLRSVFKAIFLDSEAINPVTGSQSAYGKLREPTVRLAQWGRTFGASSQSGKWIMDDLSRQQDQLGQSPLRAPSVFGFFRPQFSRIGSESHSAGLQTPKFQIVNETSVVGYVNFLQDLIAGRNYATRDVKASYAYEIDLAHDSKALLDHLDLVLTARQLTAKVRQTIFDALESRDVKRDSSESDKAGLVQTAVLLVMVSNDYLVQE